MATTKKSLTHSAASEFADGATKGAGPAFTSHADRQADALGKAHRERDAARDELARANIAANATELALAAGITDPVQRRQVVELVETDRVRSREDKAFDWAFATRSALQKVAGGLAPTDPKGEVLHPSATAKPRTFQDVSADREAYRARLRELGLLDPATSSIPGDGGGLTGGPLG